MYGKNIIGSSESFEGYELDIDRLGKKCDKAEEYIDAINFFAQHPVKRYNAYARQVFLEKYSEQATESKIYRVFSI